MNNSMLYTDLKSYFRKYVETDETEIGLLALYSTATHLYQDFQAFPLLHITGDYATGKNRRLDLLKGICLKAQIVTIPSLPSLFRSIGEEVHTILIDEADSFLKYNQFEGFLLAGYKKGGQISRAAKDDAHPKGYKPVYFDVYCPKVLVTREGIQSEPLNSRAITIITSPKSEDSVIPDVLPEDALVEGRVLKNRIESLVSTQLIVDLNVVKLGLTGRDAEIFESIKCTAIIYGEEAIRDLQSFIDHIYIPETRYNTMFSFHEDLIRVLAECWDSGERIYLKTIYEKLIAMNGDYADKKLKGVGKILRSLNFVLVPDNKLTYIVRDSKLLDIWRKRYLTNSQDVQSDLHNKNSGMEMDSRLENISDSLRVDSVGDVVETKREVPQMTERME